MPQTHPSSKSLGISTAAERPEIERPPAGAAVIGDIARPLTPAQRLWGNEAVRKFTIVIALILLWQAAALWYHRPLALPTATETFKALLQDLTPEIKAWTPRGIWDGLAAAPLISSTAASLKLLAFGYTIGVALACLLSIAAAFTRIGRDLLETLTAMFSPLPAIALVPLALIWFGLGNPWAMIFVLVHSVLWPVALNMHSGFRASPQTLRMVGLNCGLSTLGFVFKILIPASFPAILTGLKIGWAFAWRTLIAAELVFGVNGDAGGLGWFIFERKNTMDTPAVFAGLLMVIVIGLVVENVVFRTIEMRTVRRWGMQT